MSSKIRDSIVTQGPQQTHPFLPSWAGEAQRSPLCPPKLLRARRFVAETSTEDLQITEMENEDLESLRKNDWRKRVIGCQQWACPIRATDRETTFDNSASRARPTNSNCRSRQSSDLT